MRWIFAICLSLILLISKGGDTVRPGLEGIEGRLPSPEESLFLEAFKTPFFEGKDVSQALKHWFDGQLHLLGNRPEEAQKQWLLGCQALNAPLPPLPQTQWSPWPDSQFTSLGPLPSVVLNEVSVEIVQWSVNALKQYGLILKPKKMTDGSRYPLLLYCHGAAFGVPDGFLPVLAAISRLGYVILAPAMRGEYLLQSERFIDGHQLISEGEIENLEGEVDDCLAMLSAAWKLPYVRPDEFAMLGHSFGAGVGLLTAARAGKKAKAVISYDAWLVNPQRFYWDRMRRSARNWDSWEDYCNQEVTPQLIGLKKRSIILNAERIQCPLLLFIGGAYEGSVFHQSHKDFTTVLDTLKKPYTYQVIPNAGHNFVLYYNSTAAKMARGIQYRFLLQHYPPYRPNEPPTK